MASDYLGQTTQLLLGALQADQEKNKLQVQQNKIDAGSDKADPAATAIAKGTSEGMQSATRQNIAKGQQQVEQNKIDAQFIKLTPDLAKGAASATGDDGWMKQVGTSMRSDVYSSLLSYGAKTKAEQDRANKPLKITHQDSTGKTVEEMVAPDPDNPGSYKTVTDSTGAPVGGGAKFKPAAVATPKPQTPASLTAQNQRDEKTLLSAMSGKGAKGIPSDNVVTRSLGMGMSDKDKAKMAMLRSVATRLKQNNPNMGPDTASAVDKILGGSTGNPGTNPAAAGKPSAGQQFKSADDVKAAFHAGKLTRDQAKQLLQSQFGLQ